MPCHEARRCATAIAAVVLQACAAASFADPLHKIGNEGAWIHEGSGWLFPKRIESFDRVGAPYTIDGNDDVGAEYAAAADGAQFNVLVDVYYADSAAGGATLDGAKAMQRASKPGTVARVQSEEPFAVSAQPQLVGVDTPTELGGVKVTFESVEDSQGRLYFFETPAWVVTIRATARTADEDARAKLDALVRALPWRTLGSDPGDLHRGGS